MNLWHNLAVPPAAFARRPSLSEKGAAFRAATD
jgi:hypothetical protein